MCAPRRPAVTPQVAGTLAMYALERDLKQAGMGFSTGAARRHGLRRARQRRRTIARFRCCRCRSSSAPMGRRTRLNVLYGNSSFFASRDTFSDSTATTKRLTSRASFKRGDLAVVSDAAGAGPGTANCALVQVTDDSNGDLRTISHTNGAYLNFYAAGASAAATLQRGCTAGRRSPTATSTALARRRSATPGRSRAAALTRTELIRSPATPFEVADGVINMKAEYGVDTNGNRQIEAGEWTTVAPADWSRVLAIRVALAGAQQAVRAQRRR